MFDFLGFLKKTSAEPQACDEKNSLTVNDLVARTKGKGLAPTQPELIAYARYLGMDPITDGDLLWIAEEALKAPLPAEWTEHLDKADRVFYNNVQTHVSSWTHPLEKIHRDTYKTIVNFRSRNLSKEEKTVELEKMRGRLEKAERKAYQDLQEWTEDVNAQGLRFFYNQKQDRSVWTDPRPAQRHKFNLSWKALRECSKHCGQASSGHRIEPLVMEVSRSPSKKPHPPLKNSDSEGALNTENGNGDSEKKRHKKRRDREGNAKNCASGQNASDAEGQVSPRKLPLDSKKPLRTSVEDLHASSLPPHGHTISGGLFDSSQYTLQLGDGLSTLGRTKVRAGIRLEPLK